MFVQQALDTLEKAALRVMQTFQPQDIANILHIMAKKRCKTCLLPELERLVEATSGQFHSQAVASHEVDVCKDGDKAGRADEGVAGASNASFIATCGQKDGQRW